MPIRTFYSAYHATDDEPAFTSLTQEISVTFDDEDYSYSEQLHQTTIPSVLIQTFQSR